jgi:hypothetical protein
MVQFPVPADQRRQRRNGEAAMVGFIALIGGAPSRDYLKRIIARPDRWSAEGVLLSINSNGTGILAVRLSDF